MTRRSCGFTIDGDRVPHNRNGWAVTANGEQVGEITSAVWSPRLQTNVALGVIGIEHTAVGTRLTVEVPDHIRTATVAEVPFPGASQR